MVLLLAALFAGCGGPATEICGKVYGECKGALVREGSPLSREACLELIEDLPEDVASELAECITDDERGCEEIEGCF